MGLGSGIRNKPIPDPGSGSRDQKGTGSLIRIRNTEKYILKKLKALQQTLPTSSKLRVFLKLKSKVTYGTGT
jgi:hypothetical protein